MSVLGENNFEFSEKQELKLRLKDILDTEVDEKYYLSEAQVERMTTSNFNQNKFETRVQGDVARTLCARDYKDPKCVRVGGLYDKDGVTHQAGSIYDPNGVAATLSTMQGGNQEPIIIDDTYKNREAREYENEAPTLRAGRAGLKVAETTIPIRTATKQGYDLAEDGDGIDLAYPTSTTRRSRVGHGISKTLTTGGSMGALEVGENIRIRKLTPKECWRLMGFDDSDFEKAQKVNSNSQLYKQAGNSIVVNVLQSIFKNLLKESYIEDKNENLTDC